MLARSSVPLSIDYPKSGWVEQSAEQCLGGRAKSTGGLFSAGCRTRGGRHSAFPIKGRPWWPGIGTPANPWPHALCGSADGVPKSVRRCARRVWRSPFALKTGLQVDPLFPSSKIQWLFENRPEIRKLAEEGKVCLGTVDAWLVWNLTGGKRFVTDFSNASRTQLFNIGRGAWDPELLALFGVPSVCVAGGGGVQPTLWATRSFWPGIRFQSAAF